MDSILTQFLISLSTAILSLIIEYWAIQPLRKHVSQLQNNPNITVRLKPTFDIASIINRFIFFTTATASIILFLMVISGFIGSSAGLPPTTSIQVTPQSPTTIQATRAIKTHKIHIEDAEWIDGFHRSDGPTIYGGRTATWIYGTSTQYSTMRTILDVVDQPIGSDAQICIEGMDSEGPHKTQIRISINGTPVYIGENRLPDDDYNLETGTWATYCWPFDAQLLKIGKNEIAISNQEVGNYSVPPWFMLDYADITFNVDD